MTGTTVDLLASAIRNGDASSQHTFALCRLLRSQGMAVRIHSDAPRGPLPKDIRAQVQHTFMGDYVPGADLTILQYPLWFPLAERFRDARGTAVFWYHGVTPPELGTLSEHDLLQRSQVGTELAWYAHVAVTDSPFTMRELHESSGYPLDRIRVVPLGIDTASFQRVPDQETLVGLRQRWHLQGKRILLYVGRVAGNKRIDLIIDALASLADRYPDLHLLVVGDTRASAAYRELAAQLGEHTRRLGLGSRITFTGRVEAIEPYYHLAEAYILASQHEGFGAPLVEAMAAGVPVVASASGSIPWVLDAESSGAEAAGLTFVPGRAEDLARQLSGLLEDPGLRQRMIERGHRRAAHFGVERFNARAAEVIAEAVMLARQGSPPDPGYLRSPLFAQADVALRHHRVHSGVPLLGRLIEWVRINSTTHVKEAYLDRIVERQVLYNRLLADEIQRLHQEITALRAQLEEYRRSDSQPSDQEPEPPSRARP